MLLNKLPALDKGYVAYVDSSGSSDILKQLSLEFLRTEDFSTLEDMGTLTLVIKCPLFVQLNLSKFNIKIVPTLIGEVEAYLPNTGEVAAPDRQTSSLIAEDIARTSEALLINPKAYQTDGCDHFISQVLTPISAYTTLIAHGPYKEWVKFCAQAGAPVAIQAYINNVKQIVDTEWK